MNTLTIARAELRRIFLSPLAWAVLAVLQLLLGFVFVNVLFEFITNPYPGEQFGAADVVAGQVFGFATILVLLIMPLMTMRLFAEERKSGTLTLLLSAPVWGSTASSPKVTSRFLTEVRDADGGRLARTLAWAEMPDADAHNPSVGAQETAPWPLDPEPAAARSAHRAAERVARANAAIARGEEPTIGLRTRTLLA